MKSPVKNKLHTQFQQGRRLTLMEQYFNTDSLLAKCLIACEFKNMMDVDQKEGQKGAVSDLYRNKIPPKDIQAQAKQFDRLTAYAQLASDEERKVFFLLERYDDLHTQSKEHYKSCCQEAESQGIEKEETTSYSLFQPSLEERQQLASVIQHTAKPTIVANIAEDIRIPLDNLLEDSRAFDREKLLKANDEVIDKVSIPLSQNALTQDQTIPEAQQDKFSQQREKFEQKRLSLNQEWCEKFNFYQTHKRFPNPEELPVTWLQGERLTAIEGRIYQETLVKGATIDEKQLIQKAREEFLKKQAIPNDTMEFARSSSLTAAQLNQFEQHVLMHRGRMNQPPNASDLKNICQAIKIHEELMGAEKNRDMYLTFTVQQAILVRIKKDPDIEATTIKSLNIKDFCLEKTERTKAKIQSLQAFNQEMKIRDLNKHNNRGFDI